MEPQDLWPHLLSVRQRRGHPLPIKPLSLRCLLPWEYWLGLGALVQACPAWPAPVFAGSSIEEKAAAPDPSLGSGGHAGPQVPHLESVLLARFPD